MADIDAVLQRASDVVRSNLDPRAEATITFEMQKQLAADLGMSVEQLLARRGGESFNTEQAIAARALLAQSAKHVVSLAKLAAGSGDKAALDDTNIALSQHQAIQEKVAGITAEAGRALGGFRIAQSDLPQVKIANVLSKLSPEAQAEAMRLMSQPGPDRSERGAKAEPVRGEDQAEHDARQTVRVLSKLSSIISAHHPRENRVRSGNGGDGDDEESRRRWRG